MIQVGSRAIGEGLPPFVIAEIGSNFRTRDDVMASISMAAKCGADAAKYQLYTHEALYGVPGEMPQALDPAWLPAMREKADARGIELMVSAFGLPEIEAVDRVVNLHKVASAEATHVRMLESLREIGKPVILSTAAKGDADIEMALRTLGATPVVLLYCVGAYPARIQDISHMISLGSRFKRPVGLSDHTTDVIAVPRAAGMLGACVIEKHVNFVGATGPDAPHSLTTDEFKLYVQAAKDPDRLELARQAGDDPAFVLRHNRRLIATQDIPQGGTLSEGDNFGIYRSLIDDTRAASPWLIDRINGKTARRAIMAGEGIAPDDVA